ncbi:MAG: ABC transporter substrate-binding protein, partial [Deltaproteobacteria bacterium]|nr:ABC transporter substrate-binding protein [Deltaproteobacteria bacterium]
PLDSDNPAIQTYVAKYKEMFPKASVGTHSLMGYSAGAVFCEALAKCGPEPTREKLVKALESMTKFDQKIGPPITFEPVKAGPYARRGQTAVVIVQLKDGKFQSLGDFMDPVRK